MQHERALICCRSSFCCVHYGILAFFVSLVFPRGDAAEFAPLVERLPKNISGENLVACFQIFAGNAANFAILLDLFPDFFLASSSGIFFSPTEKLSEVKREEYSVYSRISDIRNLNLERNKCGTECKIFDFLDILVEMNKSLNHMLDDFVASQLILKALKSQLKSLDDQMEEHKRVVHSQNSEINKLNKKIESTHVQEV